VNVFVIQEGCIYEGGYVIGVASSIDAARERVKIAIAEFDEKEQGHKESWNQTPMEDRDPSMLHDYVVDVMKQLKPDYWRSGNGAGHDFISIKEMPLL